MPGSAVENQIARQLGGLGEIFSAVEAQHRGEFFAGEGFFVAYFFGFSNQNFGAGGYFDAGHFGDFFCALPYNSGIELAVYHNRFGQFFAVFAGNKMTAAGDKFFLHSVVNGIFHDDGLFTGANHAVIKGFAHNDGADRHFDIGRSVNDHRRIARAYADGRLAGGVSRFYHTGAAGG